MNRVPRPRRSAIAGFAILFLAPFCGQARAGIENAVDAMLENESATPVHTLTLKDCMRLAITQNKDVLRAWHRIRETELGDRLVTRSRLYPQLEFIWTYDKDHEPKHRSGATTVSPDSSSDRSATLQFSQRLFEFGKDASVEVALRAAERKALYDFENTVRSTLSSVREKFFTILLREEQIATHLELIKGFREDYEKKKQRLEQKEATIEPFDVLQGELNVLFEERSINNIERTKSVEEYALLDLMGQPIGQKIRLEGSQDETTFTVEQCVEQALANSTELAQRREEVAEQQRVLRQVAWEYFPDISLSAGFRREDDEAALTVSNVGSDTWAVDLTGDLMLDEPRSRDDYYINDTDTSYGVSATVSVPLFEGFRRLGVYNREKERLRQDELLLAKQREEIERLARQRYADMMQAARNVKVAERQVQISRRQLDIQERLKEEIPAMVSDQQFETFRNRFFRDQDSFFSEQISFVRAREQLREVMGYFEKVQPKQTGKPESNARDR